MKILQNREKHNIVNIFEHKLIYYCIHKQSVLHYITKNKILLVHKALEKNANSTKETGGWVCHVIDPQ